MIYHVKLAPVEPKVYPPAPKRDTPLPATPSTRVADVYRDNPRHRPNWTPGGHGKGIVFRNGEVHTWNTGTQGGAYHEQDGKPFHVDYIHDALGNNPPTKPEQFFRITPEGVSSHSPIHDEFVNEAHPEVQREKPNSWEFNSAATPVQNGGHHFKQYNKTTSPWELGKEGKGILLKDGLHMWSPYGEIDPHHDGIYDNVRGEYVEGGTKSWNDHYQEYYNAPKFYVGDDGTIDMPIGSGRDQLPQIVDMHPDLKMNGNNDEWSFTSAVIENEWQRAKWGKGLITSEGDGYFWAVDNQGYPHHYEYNENVLQLGDAYYSSIPLLIKPNGVVDIYAYPTESDKGTVEDIIKRFGNAWPRYMKPGSIGSFYQDNKIEDPYKLPKPDEWLFNTASFDDEHTDGEYDEEEEEFNEDDYLEQEGWLNAHKDFDHNEPVRHVDHPVHKPHYEGWDEEGEAEDATHERPVVFNGKRFYVGKPNAYHWDMIQHEPELHQHFNLDQYMGTDPATAAQDKDTLAMGRMNPETESLYWSHKGKWRRDQLDQLTQQHFPGTYDESEDMGLEDDEWHFGGILDNFRAIKHTPIDYRTPAEPGQMCRFHPEEPAVEVAGFAPMCATCARSYDQAKIGARDSDDWWAANDPEGKFRPQPAMPAAQTPATINEVDKRDPNPLYPATNRRPVIYHAQTNTVHVGPHGEHHDVLYDELGDDWDPYDVVTGIMFKEKDGSDKLRFWQDEQVPYPQAAADALKAQYGVEDQRHEDEDQWQFESKAVPQVTVHPYDEDHITKMYGYEGRRPMIYDPTNNHLHVGDDEEAHFNLCDRIAQGDDKERERLYRGHQGWLGNNPEADPHGDDIQNIDESNEYGWYDGHPGPHVDQALTTHFNAALDTNDEWHFGATGAIKVVQCKDDEIYEDSTMMDRRPIIWDRGTQTIYVGQPGWHHQGIEVTNEIPDHGLCYGWVGVGELGRSNAHGDVGWYNHAYPRDDEIEAIHSALEQELGVKTTDVSAAPDDWHFGARRITPKNYLRPTGKQPYKGLVMNDGREYRWSMYGPYADRTNHADIMIQEGIDPHDVARYIDSASTDPESWNFGRDTEIREPDYQQQYIDNTIGYRKVRASTMSEQWHALADPKCKVCYGQGGMYDPQTNQEYPCYKCMRGKVPAMTDKRIVEKDTAPRKVRRQMDKMPSEDLRRIYPTSQLDSANRLASAASELESFVRGFGNTKESPNAPVIDDDTTSAQNDMSVRMQVASEGRQPIHSRSQQSAPEARVHNRSGRVLDLEQDDDQRGIRSVDQRRRDDRRTGSSNDLQTTQGSDTNRAGIGSYLPEYSLRQSRSSRSSNSLGERTTIEGDQAERERRSSDSTTQETGRYAASIGRSVRSHQNEGATVDNRARRTQSVLSDIGSEIQDGRANGENNEASSRGRDSDSQDNARAELQPVSSLRDRRVSAQDGSLGSTRLASLAPWKPGAGEWDFNSKTAYAPGDSEDPESNWYYDHKNVEPWSKGNRGKFIVMPDGKLHDWTTQGYGAPHHMQYAMNFLKVPHVEVVEVAEVPEGAVQGYITHDGQISQYGGTPELQDIATKYFAPYAKDDEIDEWDFDGPKRTTLATTHPWYEPWTPGSEGKFLVSPDNEIHQWKVDGNGSPHHFEYGEDADIDFNGEAAAPEGWSQGYLMPEGTYNIGYGQRNPQHNGIVEKELGVTPWKVNEWSFGSKTAAKGWTPGEYGKLYVTPQGELHTWNIDENSGAPHHAEYAQQHGLDPNGIPAPNVTHGWISPEGIYDVWEPVWGHDKIIEQSGLKPSGKKEWNFSSYRPNASKSPKGTSQVYGHIGSLDPGNTVPNGRVGHSGTLGQILGNNRPTPIAPPTLSGVRVYEGYDLTPTGQGTQLPRAGHSTSTHSTGSYAQDIGPHAQGTYGNGDRRPSDKRMVTSERTTYPIPREENGNPNWIASRVAANGAPVHPILQKGLEPWKPGDQGRAISFGDGTVHSWSDGDDNWGENATYHYDAANIIGVPHDMDFYHHYILPDGRVTGGRRGCKRSRQEDPAFARER